MKNTNPRPNSIKGTLAQVLAQAAQHGEFEFALFTGELFSGDQFTLTVFDHDKTRNRQSYEIGHVRDEETIHAGILNYLEPDTSVLEQLERNKRKDALDAIAFKNKLIVLTDPNINDNLSFNTLTVQKMLEDAYEAGKQAK